MAKAFRAFVSLPICFGRKDASWMAVVEGVSQQRYVWEKKSMLI